jgi:hypothetical protein
VTAEAVSVPVEAGKLEAQPMQDEDDFEALKQSNARKVSTAFDELEGNPQPTDETTAPEAEAKPEPTKAPPVGSARAAPRTVRSNSPNTKPTAAPKPATVSPKQDQNPAKPQADPNEPSPDW